MAKMDELELLGILNTEEQDARDYVHGDLAENVRPHYREYLRSALWQMSRTAAVLSCHRTCSILSKACYPDLLDRVRVV